MTKQNFNIFKITRYHKKNCTTTTEKLFVFWIVRLKYVCGRVACGNRSKPRSNWVCFLLTRIDWVGSGFLIF